MCVGLRNYGHPCARHTSKPGVTPTRAGLRKVFDTTVVSIHSPGFGSSRTAWAVVMAAITTGVKVPDDAISDAVADLNLN